MRRRPHEDQRKHQPRFDRKTARRDDPADHRRKRTCRATDDDVLRRRPLEPHRIDHGIKEDREGQQRRGQQIRGQPSIITDRPDSATPMPALRRVHPARRDRARAVRRITASISASHHMFSAPDAPAPIAMNRIDAKPTIGCTGTGAANRPTSAVKTTNRHHARLHQGESNRPAAPRILRCCLIRSCQSLMILIRVRTGAQARLRRITLTRLHRLRHASIFVFGLAEPLFV